MRMIYSETLMDHFERPRFAGRFDSDGPDIGTGSAGSRETGGVLRLQIRVDEQGNIGAVRFQAYGPPALIAAGSWLAEALHSKSLDEALGITHKRVADALALPTTSLHFALLGEDAVRTAIQDYKDKQKVYA
ncbi:MAG TPA: iron-sulfur cluster assembly scaffold protein [Burkholderiaceae bacterium]|nr:iron-sulfur cluster assembly scaffold protein [Burkholderiaceae bacterium]